MFDDSHRVDNVGKTNISPSLMDHESNDTFRVTMSGEIVLVFSALVDHPDPCLLSLCYLPRHTTRVTRFTLNVPVTLSRRDTTRPRQA